MFGSGWKNSVNTKFFHSFNRVEIFIPAQKSSYYSPLVSLNVFNKIFYLQILIPISLTLSKQFQFFENLDRIESLFLFASGPSFHWCQYSVKTTVSEERTFRRMFVRVFFSSLSWCALIRIYLASSGGYCGVL